MGAHWWLPTWCYILFSSHRLSMVPSRCPHVLWCHWREIEPFSTTLAQGVLAECDQPGINPLKYSTMEDRQWISFIFPLSYHDRLNPHSYIYVLFFLSRTLHVVDSLDRNLCELWMRFSQLASYSWHLVMIWSDNSHGILVEFSPDIHRPWGNQLPDPINHLENLQESWKGWNGWWF